MRKHSPIVVVTLVLAVACSDKKSGSDVLSARIVEPNGIATILRGTAFDLRATFADGPNAVTPDSVSWRSSETDDQLPQTNPAHNVVLTPGVRAISVTGKLAGKEGSDQVEITVGDIGVAIARPTNRRQVAPGQTVALQGEGQAYSGVNQIQLNPVNAVFAWTADGVAFGGNQNQLQSPMTLTVGEHTIELTITYSDPATTTVFSGSARITLVVNTAPAVSITAPNCPIDLPAGSPQTFVGIASDAEDGPLTGSWVDLLTGEDTSGDTWVFASDVIGKHELEYSAADSTDHIARDTCGVRVYPVGESAAALFPSAAAVSSAMPNDNIEVVYLDGSGNLLAGSHGQLAVFDTALALINDGSGSSNPYDGTELGVGGGSTVRDVIIVGTKLLAATADGLAQCDYSAGNLSACTDIGDGQDFNGVAFASDTPLGGVLASSAVDGLFVATYSAGSITASHFYDRDVLTTRDDIRDVLFVGGALYVATDSGVCVLNDPAAAAAVIATTLCDDVIAVNDARSLSHRNGVLWIGTDNGLVRRDLSSGGAVTFDRDAGLPSDNINDVVVAPDGIVWVATDSGVGRLDPETGHVVTLSPPDWNGSAQVNSILIAPDGSKWFGTDEGVVHYVGA